MDATTVNTRTERLALPVEALLTAGVATASAAVPEVTGTVGVEDMDTNVDVDVDTDVDVVAVVEGVDVGAKVEIELDVVNALDDRARLDLELDNAELVDRTEVIIRDEVVVAIVVVDVAPIVLVEVPTPSEVTIVDGIGIADVADGRGVSNDPFMPVSL